MQAARRREVDAIVVWRLDRWSRSVADLIVTLRELTDLGVGFVSLTEALDLTTSTGRAMASLLAVFAEFEREILRERVRAGIAQTHQECRRNLSAQGCPGQSLGDRATSWSRPDLSAKDLGRTLRIEP